jgi:hypothetical protein
MRQYIIESPHTKDECIAALTLVESAGYLTHFKWGCPDGTHCGWAMIEAENENEALLSVPTLIRKKARITPIVEYTSKEIDMMHER